MGQRKTPPLSFPEYVSRDVNNSTEVSDARVLLIETTRRVLPEMLEKLATEVFPHFEQLSREGHDLATILNSNNPFAALTDAAGLKSALNQWAGEFNITASWLLDDALRTLRAWNRAPEWLVSRKWNPVRYSARPILEITPFEFRCKGWDPQNTNWPTYRHSVRKQVEKELSDYEKQMRQRAEALGLVRARRQYSVRDFEWFVRYQFGGTSSTGIADEYYSDDSTVLKGIKIVAQLIAWPTLRNSTPVTRSRKMPARRRKTG